MSYQQQPPLPQQPQPVYFVPVRPPSNATATTGLVFGLIAAVIGIWAPVLGIAAAVVAFVPAVVAVSFGHDGLKRSRMMGGYGHGAAKTALILGYSTLGLIAAVTLFWVLASVIGARSS